MRKVYPCAFLSVIICCTVACSSLHAQLAGYTYSGNFQPAENTVQNKVQFNGYTSYWHDEYKQWFRYGNLFKMSTADPALTVMQSKADIAEDLMVPGFEMQEGFMNALLSSDYKFAAYPSLKEIEGSNENLLLLTDPASEAGKSLLQKFEPDTLWKGQLKSHQANAADYKKVFAFMLEKENRRLF